MTSYTVTVSREPPWWVAVIAGLPGGATEARRLDHLEVEVRDLIAGLTDSSEDAFDLDWEYALPPELAWPVREFVEARARRQAAERDYGAAQEQAVDALTAAQVSVRDAAELLGLSPSGCAAERPGARYEPGTERPGARYEPGTAGPGTGQRPPSPGTTCAARSRRLILLPATGRLACPPALPRATGTWSRRGARNRAPLR